VRANRARQATAVAMLLVFGACEPKSDDLAEGWREMLRGVLPAEATNLGVLANHYDNGVRIFEYQLPTQEPSAVLAAIETRFAKSYLGYVVTDRTSDMIRLRCRDAAARHWGSVQYEFHVCNRGPARVVGMSIGNNMVDSLRREYEAEARQQAHRACGRATTPSNKELKLTKPGELRSFAA